MDKMIKLYKGLCKLYEIVEDTDYTQTHYQGLCINVISLLKESYYTGFKPVELYKIVDTYLEMHLPDKIVGNEEKGYYSWEPSDKQSRLDWLYTQIAIVELDMASEGIDVTKLNSTSQESNIDQVVHETLQHGDINF